MKTLFLTISMVTFLAVLLVAGSAAANRPSVVLPTANYTAVADTSWSSDPTETWGDSCCIHAQVKDAPDCDISRASYARAGLIKWDVSGFAGETISKVEIEIPRFIHTTHVHWASTRLGVWPEVNAHWGETTPSGELPHPPNPVLNPPLQKRALPTDFTPVVYTFSGWNDPVVQFIQQQVDGDGFASFWFLLVDDCTAVEQDASLTDTPQQSAFVRSDWRGAVGTDALPAASAKFRVWDINAVTFSKADVKSQEVNWLSLVGLVFLLGAVVAGVSYGAHRLNP